MPEMRVLLTLVAVLAPLVASALASRRPGGRRISVIASLVACSALTAAVAFTEPAAGIVTIDELASAPAIVFSAVMLVTFIATPVRDVAGPACARLLFSMAGTLLLYTASSLPVLFIGWTASALPFLRFLTSSVHAPVKAYARPAVMLLASVMALGVSVLLLGLGSEASGVARTQAENPIALWAVAFAVLAVLIGNGIFPFHSWVIAAFEEEKLYSAVWLVSAQPGAVLLARFALPAFAESAQAALPYVFYLALVNALVMAFIGLGEKAPRRVLAFVTASHSGFIVSGLAMGNIAGATGALVHWLGVAVSATGLLVLLRCLESRYSGPLEQPWLGFGSKAPRLAVLFLLFGLSLAGLPGMLGFCAEDLLFHGALEAQSYLGLALPVATALNAISLFRLFSNLFLGKRQLNVPGIKDCLPRERWALSALAVALVATGLSPHWLIHSRIPPASAIAGERHVRRRPILIEDGTPPPVHTGPHYSGQTQVRLDLQRLLTAPCPPSVHADDPLALEARE